MVTFDSPILLCEICGEVVLRDTKWKDCARAHKCTQDPCPYKDAFIEQPAEERNQRYSGRDSRARGTN